ncbi:hypothetical protein M0J30_005749 [Klebsiella oxytoca]|uniref:hypothetical protein n=1 Tax=Klebsiella oxytoca TaxID=571 RepID=UPI000D00E2C7|nr:hypothetical protein [Klebsiella oxytoca]AVL79813.1 hypothetical protein CEQ13_06285 [Klebsiella oxytoca]EKX5085870.1 hypothetical protein [Klebsiella oxytoca]EKX5097926.1 hypothetical protein [Klebsiella oxytoca]ELQ8990429.1 hypothetical protein [Klebsiella oxytoca]NDR45758.1 hypothetical protein [Klebsiella oxytoca]
MRSIASGKFSRTAHRSRGRRKAPCPGYGFSVVCGQAARTDAQHRLREKALPAKSVKKRIHPHFLPPIPCFVTSSIVFFYIYSDLFSRSLWITSAFSAVRFNVHAIYRSHIGHIARNFYHFLELLMTAC